MTAGSRRPPASSGRSYRRYGRGDGGPRRRRTLLWLLLIVVMVAAAGLALARNASNDDTTPAAADGTTVPVQRLLIREGLRREDVARLLDRETVDLRRPLPGAHRPRGARTGARGHPPPDLARGLPVPRDVRDHQGHHGARSSWTSSCAAYRDNTADVNYRYAAARNLTKFDVLTIASMIEREVAVASERPLVASVIYNRLHAGMRLDIDATVQYAIGQWKKDLTAADLATDSPYNTRRFGGLPPGPIASPGKDSIRAAAHPAPTQYLYYVARNDGSGAPLLLAHPGPVRGRRGPLPGQRRTATWPRSTRGPGSRGSSGGPWTTRCRRRCTTRPSRRWA